VLLLQMKSQRTGTGPCSPMVKSIGCGLARTLAPQITLGYCLSQLSETFSHQPIVNHRQSAQ
jgi:hypothetical protein